MEKLKGARDEIRPKKKTLSAGQAGPHKSGGLYIG